MRAIGILAGLMLAIFATLVHSAESNIVSKQPIAEAESRRLIVKMKPASNFTALSASAESSAVPAKRAMQSLANRIKVNVVQSRLIMKDMQVMQWQPQTPGETADAVLERLRADPAVEFAELDRRQYPQAMPNDALFSGQWFLQNAQPAATNAVAAWDVTTGNFGVVVAVLDSGIRFGHTDLRDTANSANRLLPGYDFVSTSDGDGDGDSRDADPSDPGDFVSQSAATDTCAAQDSSWHGTRVSGMIGALSNNGGGVSGMTWSGWILPVRVLGKCGGYDSDIISAMLWAAGIHVDGVPDNQYPAQVENLSLGSVGSCSASYQTALRQVTAKGVLVVISAGNEGGPVGTPANCPGAMAIAGIRHAGTKVSFSSLGPQIALSAPGGNCVNTNGGPCLFSLDTTTNAGTTTPTTSSFTDMTNRNVGTSFAAPIVSGIAGLMLSVNGNLKSSQLIARLQEGATPFPTSSDPAIPACRIPSSTTDLQTLECNCTTTTCGAGMANAAQAVQAALRPIAAVAASTATNVTPGTAITLNASSSAAACNRTIVSYSWKTLSGTNAGGIASANTSMPTVTTPASGSTYTVQLTITDDAGLTDTANVVVSSTGYTSSAPTTAGTTACLQAVSYSAPATAADGASSGVPTPPPTTTPPPTSTTPPANSGGGGGGGGALDWLVLLMLAVPVLCLAFYPPVTRSALSNRDF